MDEVKHFGKYEILEELGKGGFGTVYRVREPVLNIERAIKVLHPNLLSDDSFLTRFKHEAQVSAHLEHSNIVPVYELDQVDGLNYIVMKYMPGGSLIDLLRRQGHLDLEETLPYFENMCAGVQFAHKNGVIHRDLKPNNLLIDEFDHMRVSDFGFAKAMASGDSASMSSTGSLIGTPAY
ncbi:MAG: serine/threonine protein kinase, partial [Clostridiales bacterium]|nr:serine/threonine protein kinase [Clostridiales bacterium]